MFLHSILAYKTIAYMQQGIDACSFIQYTSLQYNSILAAKVMMYVPSYSILAYNTIAYMQQGIDACSFVQYTSLQYNSILAAKVLVYVPSYSTLVYKTCYSILHCMYHFVSNEQTILLSKRNDRRTDHCILLVSLHANCTGHNWHT